MQKPDWSNASAYLDLFLSQAGKTKQDFFQILAREGKAFLEALLAESTLEIHAQIKLVPSEKKEGLEVEIISKKTKVRSSKKPKATRKNKTTQKDKKA